MIELASGLRRWLQAPVRKGVGSNPTAVTLHAVCKHQNSAGGSPLVASATEVQGQLHHPTAEASLGTPWGWPSAEAAQLAAPRADSHVTSTDSLAERSKALA